jgi:Xaa-Pro aminopeptidase
MDYLSRITRLQRALKTHGLESYLVENPTDIYYLTGQMLSVGSLLITEDKARLRVDGRYFEKCRLNSVAEVLLDKDVPLSEFFKGLEIVGFDPHFTTYARALMLRAVKGKKKLSFKKKEHVVMQLRAFKDAEEMALIKKAIELGAKGHAFLLGKLKAYSQEKELKNALKIFLLEEACEEPSFDPIIAFGKNSAIPHHTAGEALLKEEDQVLLDMGARYQKYCSDFTRTHYFGGVRSKKLEEIYKVVKEAKECAEALLRPGVKISDLDIAARRVIEKAGYGNYYPHGLGHGIGLDIHEPPFLRKGVPFLNNCLEEGMVVTIEPGIYLPEIGGVRLEDMVFITQDGYQNLTKPYLTKI